ncbi:MAG: hypothetical protein QNJ14_04250 [Woeseiaceae bacterium]|nr:hypothetical protein [Woeseiaceae bacterium]
MNNTITRPCTVCQAAIVVASLDDAFCGPACSALYDRRKRAHDKNRQPGHPDFYSTDPKEARRHDRNVSRRYR